VLSLKRVKKSEDINSV